jgi:mannose-6-phosphate isomerase-like protein (cupin superfamily)
MQSPSVFSLPQMQRRLVRYADLRPCTTAFVDARTPGSDRKENFTIIGPGVAENPDQFVHIDIPHGFNIGGARQPPHCVNSQHSHETAEVFVIHSGRWRFTTGEHGTDGQVDLAPGDTISIPTHVFRGFENIGEGPGFMFAVLGGDDPGRVTWAPYVFEAAARHGLVLLESGRLIDTTHETVAAGAKRMPVTTAAVVASMPHVDSDGIAACTVAAGSLRGGGGLSALAGIEECPIVGPANAAEGMAAGRMSWNHGFQLRAMKFAAHAVVPPHSRQEEEVLLMHRGALIARWSGGEFALGPGDTLTVPKDLVREFVNAGTEPAVAYVVRGGDQPTEARFTAAPIGAD